MSLLARLLNPTIEAGSPGPADDYWYTELSAGGIAQTGIRVDAVRALNASAVYACVKVLAESVASLPLITYEVQGDGGKHRATDHPLFELLHDQPNAFQSSFEFREMMMGHVALSGNAYAQIIPGRRGFAEQLIPLHPDRMRAEKLVNGRLRYVYNREDGQRVDFNQEDIHHLRGWSADGVTGMSVVGLARDSIGLAIATESYGGRYFSQNAQPGGVLEHPAKLSDEAGKRITSSWQSAHAGVPNAHKVAVLEEGLKWHQIGLSNEDSQFLETRKFQIAEIARWFRIPPHMIGDLEKATFSNIEHQSINFVVHTLRPWLVRWEQAIRRDLILRPEQFTVEFVADGLLRGDTKSRYEAYSQGINAGWMTRNEVRRLENLNPLPGLDEPLAPLNMATGNPPPAAGPGQAQLIAEEAAGRVVRRETSAIGKAARRHSGDVEAFNDSVRAFYSDHQGFVIETMKIEPADAERYVTRQRDEVLFAGATVIEDWESTRPQALARTALDHNEGEQA